MAAPRRRASILAARTEQLGVTYSRFSSEKQGSIAEQDGINDDVADDEGVRIVARFADEGLSRSLAERPDLMKLFAHLESHPEVGFIVINELERLTAGLGQRMKVIELCQRLRVTILTEDIGRIDPFDEMKMAEADQRALTANMEVLKIRRRTKRNLRQKVIAGTVAMRPAFGTRMKPLVAPDGTVLPSGARLLGENGKVVRSGKLETHPEELPWLVQMFEWAAEGISTEVIASRLNEAKVPTKSGRSAWRGNTVRGILSNPLYKGEMTWGLQATVRDGTTGKKRLEVRAEDDAGIVTKPSPLGALVSPILWEKVQEIREVNANNRNLARLPKEPRVFDGMVYCGRCGQKMHGRPEYYKPAGATEKQVVGYRYYCSSGRPGVRPLAAYGKVCKTVASMSEKKVFQALGTLGLDDLGEVLVSVRREVGLDRTAELAVLRRQIVEATSEKDRAIRFGLKGTITEEQMDLAVLECETTIRSAESQVAALQGQSTSVEDAPWRARAAKDLRELPDLLALSSLPVHDKVEAIRRIGIKRLYVDSPRVEVSLT